ncbi:preprotein translocase subunit SecY [Candidatus Peregrinibacteria bacterium]|nr:preprotein translocase subunit SecY [Candidatus Peregrinibacteria bacterium]
MNYFAQIWNSKDLRKKIIYTVVMLIFYRILAHIPIPLQNINFQSLKEISTGALGVFSALTGGSLQNFSIILMGLSPYINASIIVQLMTVVFPKLEALSKEGEQGRRKINSYTRWLTFPFAFLQSYGVIFLIAKSVQGAQVINPYDYTAVIPAMFITTAGTILLMWIGELISEKGIGNGISLIITTGIVSSIPGVFGNIIAGIDAGESAKIPSFALLIILTFIMLIIVVLVTEGQRRIPITYASRNVQHSASSLPIRVLQAGMIPIIFAISLISFPGVVSQFLGSTGPVTDFLSRHFNSSNPTTFYLIVYALLIVFFSFFYVSVTFNPEKIAEDIQKRGGFIPGHRPGKETSNYIGRVSVRLNLWGGIFLALVAIIPIIFTMFSDLSRSDLILSGSGLIIIVGVVLDLIRRINSELVMHDYEKLV